MNFKVGDDIKVLSGQYAGMRGKVVSIMEDVIYSILVSVEGFGKLWFTPEQITNSSDDAAIEIYQYLTDQDDLLPTCYLPQRQIPAFAAIINKYKDKN